MTEKEGTGVETNVATSLFDSIYRARMEQTIKVRKEMADYAAHVKGGLLQGAPRFAEAIFPPAWTNGCSRRTGKERSEVGHQIVMKRLPLTRKMNEPSQAFESPSHVFYAALVKGSLLQGAP